jgi:pyridoxine kinase
MFCLRRLGVEAVVLPTTLMGRHPGWGVPGGGAVEVEHLQSMWRAIYDQGIVFDGILTGYMGQDNHIPLCAEIITDIRAKNSESFTLVDPVLGDNGALYIPERRAQAIKKTLIPLADLITPNLWELSYLSGKELPFHSDVLSECRRLNCNSVVTSVQHGEDIGAIWMNYDSVSKPRAGQISHERFGHMPHGGGDCLAALLIAHLLSGLDLETATQKSVASIFAIMKQAHKNGGKNTNDGELPLVEAQDALIDAPALFHQNLNFKI